MSFIIDAHEDMAYNILTFGRDYRLSVAETRQREEGNALIYDNTGRSLLGWPEYQQGRVAVIFSTLFLAPQNHAGGDWENQVYGSFSQARELHRKQLNVYRELCDRNPDKFRQILTLNDLNDVLRPWQQPVTDPAATAPVGLILSMEGAEGVQELSELEEWWQLGLRFIGPVWAGTRFFGGMYEKGPATKEGFQLLNTMAEIGYGLDISHMTESSALAAIDHYEGVVIASHSNVRKLVPGPSEERHLSDAILERLIERDGVVGVLPFNKFLVSNWQKGDPRENVTLKHLANHIDAICQIAGNARHVAIGTDFDGGFGWPAVPLEVNTIADVQKIGPILSERGYSTEDIDAIFGTNWQRILERVLPK